MSHGNSRNNFSKIVKSIISSFSDNSIPKNKESIKIGNTDFLFSKMISIISCGFCCTTVSKSLAYASDELSIKMSFTSTNLGRFCFFNLLLVIICSHCALLIFFPETGEVIHPEWIFVLL